MQEVQLSRKTISIVRVARVAWGGINGDDVNRRQKEPHKKDHPNKSKQNNPNTKILGISATTQSPQKVYLKIKKKFTEI